MWGCAGVGRHPPTPIPHGSDCERLCWQEAQELFSHPFRKLVKGRPLLREWKVAPFDVRVGGRAWCAPGAPQGGCSWCGFLRKSLHQRPCDPF